MQRIGGYVNWGTASDGRMKTQVREDVHGLDFILQLRPVSYQVDAVKLDRLLRQGTEEAASRKEDLSTEEKNRPRKDGKSTKATSGKNPPFAIPGLLPRRWSEP